MDFYRVEFYRVLDTVDAQTTEKFMQPGIQSLKELENSLLTPITNDAAVQKDPELNEEDIKVQVQGQHNCRCCACFERNAPWSPWRIWSGRDISKIGDGGAHIICWGRAQF